MGSLYDDDVFPPVWGPQAPHVRRVLDRLYAESGPQRPFFEGLREAVEEFLHACRVLDAAEQAALIKNDRDAATSQSRRASLAGFRAALFGYLNAGYAVLDAIAVLELGRVPHKPWIEWTDRLERSAYDPVRQMLARILTIRLYQPRHVLSVHRKGWLVRAFLVGGGSASLARRPLTVPEPEPSLVARVAEAYAVLGIEVREVSEILPMAAEAFAPRAGNCTPGLREVHGALLDKYGVQMAPVAAITPSLLALVERVGLAPVD
jgi:hypothetical protein